MFPGVGGCGAALLRGCAAVGLCGCVAVPLCCAVVHGGMRGCKPAEAAAVRACEHQSGRVAARCPQTPGEREGVTPKAAEGST